MTRPTKTKARAIATAQDVKDGKQSTLWNALYLGKEVAKTSIEYSVPAVSSQRYLIGKFSKKMSVCRHYTKSQREKITALYHSYIKDGSSLPNAVLKMRTTESGCALLSEKTIRRWLKQDEGQVIPKKRGVKLNEEFEDAVISGLVVSHVENSSTTTTMTVIANGAFSYECYRIVAQRLQKSPQFKDDPIVKKLQFSNNWVRKFCLRQKMRRRRCTTTSKNIPSEEEVQDQMSQIQDYIDMQCLPPEQIFNEDETGIHWCMPLTHQFIMTDAYRSYTPPGDDSGRFTAMLGSNGLGSMLPLFMILRSSCKSSMDLSRSTLLKTILDSRRLGIGWSIKMFEMEINNVQYLRPYLIHEHTLTVITVQNKAWNDMIGMIMHIRLQLGPYRRRYFPGKECLLIVDNCGCHKVPQVQQEMNANGWSMKYFPPNMTGELQPMDLVVNSTCKQALRRFRISQSLDALSEFRSEYLQALVAGNRNIPTFTPPQPTYHDGILQMIDLMRTDFTAPKFQESLARCFVKVGLTRGPNGWMKYQRKTLGKTNRCLTEEEKIMGDFHYYINA